MDAARKTLEQAELFGATAKAAPAPPPPPQASLRLLGVYAAPGRDSYAVLVVDNGKPEVTLEGSEIRPGLVLHEVAPDHALVRRRGKLERVELPQPRPAR